MSLWCVFVVSLSMRYLCSRLVSTSCFVSLSSLCSHLSCHSAPPWLFRACFPLYQQKACRFADCVATRNSELFQAVTCPSVRPQDAKRPYHTRCSQLQCSLRCFAALPLAKHLGETPRTSCSTCRCGVTTLSQHTLLKTHRRTTSAPRQKRASLCPSCPGSQLPNAACALLRASSYSQIFK